jgi:hypothetical protein
MAIWSAFAEILGRDVSIWGLTSPLLSWVGSAGLILFFGWQTTKLFLEVSRATTPFVAVEPLLTSLAEEIEPSDLQHAFDRAIADGREAPPGAKTGGRQATDFDRLTELDSAMRATGAFRRPWVQFRKTLLIEHVAWFKEPHIYSTRRAEEFFTQEVTLRGSIDLGFYEQVPSLITGLGLLLTFVAICTGLNRLHADGTIVTGVQGLINGLAGKFLTSIVALVCANLFVLLERPTVQRLLDRHADFLTLLEESFPRRTVEDLLDGLGHNRTARRMLVAEGRVADRETPERLRTSIEALAAAVRTLSDRVDPAPAAPVFASRASHRESRRG